MKPLIKSLSALAIGAIFAGTAFAGPGDAYAGPVANRTPINPEPFNLANVFRLQGPTPTVVAEKKTPRTTIAVYKARKEKSKTSERSDR